MKKLLFLFICLNLLTYVYAQEAYQVPIIKGDSGANGMNGSDATIPSGMITFIRSGSCPVGWTEQIDMAGYMFLATNTTNADMNTTGGNDTYTPLGTVSQPTFTGTPATLTGNVSNATLTMNAMTLTGNVTSAFLNVTDSALTMDAKILTGNITTASLNLTSRVLTMDTTSAASAGALKNGTTTNTGTVAAHTHTVTGNLTSAAGNLTSRVLTINTYTATGNLTNRIGNLTNTSLTMDAYTSTGNLTNTTISINSYTPAGSVSTPSFTGTEFDNRPKFIKVICCMKD